MSCILDRNKPDWKAYALGEMAPAVRREAETHASACQECHAELAATRITLDALSTLREEEMPRRIAFVSDKVFEPRWWQRFSPRFSFAGAGLVAAAILVHAFVRPISVPMASQNPAALETQIRAQVQSQIGAEIDRQVQQRVAAQLSSAIESAVTKAVAETQKQEGERTVKLLAAAERRYAESADILNKQVGLMYAMNTGAGAR